MNFRFHEFGPEFRTHGQVWMHHSIPTVTMDGGLGVTTQLTDEELDRLTTDEIEHRQMPKEVFLTHCVESQLNDVAERVLYDAHFKRLLDLTVDEKIDHISYRQFRRLYNQIRNIVQFPPAAYGTGPPAAPEVVAPEVAAMATGPVATTCCCVLM